MHGRLSNYEAKECMCAVIFVSIDLYAYQHLIAYLRICLCVCFRVCMKISVFSLAWSSASSPKGNYNTADAVSYHELNIEQSEIVLITVTGPLL